MIVKNSKFLIGAVSPKQYPDTGYPEFALCGRSNVGKSSFINRIIRRKNLARTSSQPGKTSTTTRSKPTARRSISSICLAMALPKRARRSAKNGDGSSRTIF